MGATIAARNGKKVKFLSDLGAQKKNVKKEIPAFARKKK